MGGGDVGKVGVQVHGRSVTSTPLTCHPLRGCALVV
jgi:hypothetical protein